MCRFKFPEFYKVFSLVYFLFVMAFSSFSQNELPTQIKFSSIGVEDGLPNNIINTIAQDSLGFIWIGTNDGLARYDGKKFKIYKESFDKTNSISNNFIQFLYTDSKGDLWILTDQGLNKYETQKESFIVYSNETRNGLTNNSVTTIVEDKNNNYFVGSYGGGIDVLKGDRVVKNFSPRTIPSMTSDLISSMIFQNDSTLLFGTYNDGLHKLNLSNNSIERIQLGTDQDAAGVKISSLIIDENENLWVGSNQGLIVINFSKNFSININKQNCKSFTDNDLLSVFIDQDDVIWLGTRNTGALTANKHHILKNGVKSNFKNYSPNIDQSSVDYRSISTFFQDLQGNIWIGTHFSGINIVNTKGNDIKFYDYFFNKEKKSNSHSVWGLTEDKENNLWIGTDGSGLYKLNPYTSTVKNFIASEEHGALSDNAILSLCMDSKDNLWVGTYSGGLNKLAKNSNNFVNYKSDFSSNSLNSNDVRVIYEDTNENIWIGTNGGGLHIYQPKTNDFKFISEVGWLDIRALLDDSQGNLWIGTFGNGVLSYNYELNKLTEHPEFNEHKANIIFSLAKSSPKDLWLGTRYKGLFHLDLRTKKIKRYTEEDGMSNNTVQSIVVESPNNIWLSTNNGINFFDTENSNFINFSSINGVQTAPFNNNSGIISASGHIAFGGSKGLNIFNPNNVRTDTENYDILITDFKIFNNSIQVSTPENKTSLLQSITNSNSIELKHNEDVITIDYTALRYPNSDGISYAYKLENYDNDWNIVGNINSATYRNLSPGEYIFKVKVDDLVNNVSSPIRNLKIFIKPPFWLTIPAIIIYILLIFTISYIIGKYYTDRIKLKNSLYYEKKIRQQESDLNKERFRFFTNFSHELRTPLTLILGPIKDILKSENNSSKKKKLKLVKRNADVLLDRVNKMLEFRKTETEHNHLVLGKYNLKFFISEMVKNFQFYADEKNILMTINIDDSFYCWFDHRKMQLVINNVISNALKYTMTGGHVKFFSEENGNYITLKISDTGIGINKDSLNTIFELYYHKDRVESVEGTGLGLALGKKIMDLHKAEFTVDSELSKGTCFSIQFFQEKQHFSEMSNIEYRDDEILTFKPPFIKDYTFRKNELKYITEFEENDKIVLIVDDNLDIIEYLEDILTPNYKVFTAINGKDGIEKALDIIPDIIISDIMMPEKSGIDLCNELKSHNKTSHIPIILLTAKLGDESKKDSLKIGADDYVTKPFESEFLLLRIENLFKNRKRIIDHFELNSLNVLNKEKTKETIFLDKVEALVVKKYDGSDVSIPEIAQELGFSRSSLYRKIKAITGLSINHFIREIRLRKAAKLIKEDNFNVSEAAYESGFTDLKYFGSCFKELFGVVPSEFKKQSKVKKLKKS